jgi:beta-lactamase class A
MIEYPRYPRRRRRRRSGSFVPLVVLLAGAVLLSVATLAFLRPSGSDRTLLGNLGSPIVAGGPTMSAARQQALTASLKAIVAASGGRAGVELIDLRSGQPVRIGENETASFDAASTYKLPLLMADAERIAAGSAKPDDSLCFQESDQEDGWFDDYAPGDCFSREELARRIGVYSDNTAAHMLVDNLGGPDALNAYARARGAVDSVFYDPNSTTPLDLANLWLAEAQGRAGGGGAQQWLYPLLTHTYFESGIPAGVPGGVTVVHKVGDYDGTVDDAGLVLAPNTRYILAITTEGLGGDAGYSLVAHISAAVWNFETSG